jgi:hypothetical protein
LGCNKKSGSLKWVPDRHVKDCLTKLVQTGLDMSDQVCAVRPTLESELAYLQPLGPKMFWEEAYFMPVYGVFWSIFCEVATVALLLTWLYVFRLEFTSPSLVLSSKARLVDLMRDYASALYREIQEETTQCSFHCLARRWRKTACFFRNATRTCATSEKWYAATSLRFRASRHFWHSHELAHRASMRSSKEIISHIFKIRWISTFPLREPSEQFNSFTPITDAILLLRCSLGALVVSLCTQLLVSAPLSFRADSKVRRMLFCLKKRRAKGLFSGRHFH